jgi:hypothetical protein
MTVIYPNKTKLCLTLSSLWGLPVRHLLGPAAFEASSSMTGLSRMPARSGFADRRICDGLCDRKGAPRAHCPRCHIFARLRIIMEQVPNVDPARLPARAWCGKAARRDLWGRCRLPGTSTRQVSLGSALQLGNRTQDHEPPPATEGKVGRHA